MQFHAHGYVSGDPRVHPAAEGATRRSEGFPEEVDVLVVGAGPAGMIAAAQLSRFTGVNARIIDRRPGRLEVGQADGIQARSVETFQAFGFAGRVMEEAYHVNEISYWKPDPADPSRVIRSGRTIENDPPVSEFPHLIVNQARVLDYFAEYMRNAPTRMTPDYGIEFQSLAVHDGEEFPVHVTLARVTEEGAGRAFTVRAKYVVGADGARSRVREQIGLALEGTRSDHAWGVMDVLAVTDFPDIRKECVVQSSEQGNILMVPREGGYLTRFYVDLGEVDPVEGRAVRATPVDEVIARANRILHPYRIDVRSVAWYSVYEVGHRLTERFDDADAARGRPARVFIAGDACHTHSAKAGQGMNVSMQDGFNLGWKLGHVLEGRATAALLATYSEERHTVARNLIDFDREWSTLMAQPLDELGDPEELERAYLASAEFTSGFMTKYAPSLITSGDGHQGWAGGFHIGERFRSAPVMRVCDGARRELGHEATADGRWRVHVFADARGPASQLDRLAEWLRSSDESPLADPGHDARDRFDVKLIHQEPHLDVDITRVPQVFRPTVGPYGLVDSENVFSACPEDDIFDRCEVDRRGAIVIVRPDQYVSAVLPLGDTAGLAAFFAPILRSAARAG